MSENKYPWSLKMILKSAISLDQVRKEDLKFGDFVLVVTQNSTYLLYILQNDFYLVSGGWFDRNGFSPVKIQINGCTWGGNTIKGDIVAGCGMHLEFSNGIVTSKIQEVIVLNMDTKN
jgi:hypothetical protein